MTELFEQIPLNFKRLPSDEMKARAKAFAAHLDQRRTVREFSPEPVDPEIIKACIQAAGTAPSGAHRQPWHFAVVTDPMLKRRIREAAEIEERAFYAGAYGEEWVQDVLPFGTSWEKPFLETAPYLIVVFRQSYSLRPTGEKVRHYYVPESIGIAAGMLLSALHTAGLATLTHTPNPMGFLREILGRPDYEKAIMIIVAGYPAHDATVPKLERKPLDQICTFHEAS